MPTTHRKKQNLSRKLSGRVNRSISFSVELHAYVTRKAQSERRSFNWIVNDLLSKELSAAE